MVNKVSQILGIKYPIIQAAMHTLTNAKLVAAVSNAGGLGILGPNPGWQPSMNNKDYFLGATDLIRDQIEKTKKLTNKPFAVELAFAVGKPLDDPQVKKIYELIIDEGVPVVLLYNYVTPEIVKLFHDHNIKIIYRDFLPTAKSTEKAVKAGVDVLIATGFDEGGSIPSKEIGTFSILPYIVDHAHNVPVLAAGGIVDKRTVKAAFDLGAEGVYVGTAFLATEEAPLAENVKKLLVKDDADDLILFRAVPKWYRMIKSKLTDRLLPLNDGTKTGKEIFKAAGGYPAMLKGFTEGDLDKGWVTVGTDIGLIHDIVPVATLVKRLASGLPE